MSNLHFCCIFHATGISIFFVIFLILSIILIYAAISFAFISNFFDPEPGSNLFCNTLFQCYITIMTEGLVGGFGAVSLNFLITYTDFNLFRFQQIIWPKATIFWSLLETLTYWLDIFCDSICCWFASYCSSLDSQVYWVQSWSSKTNTDT